MTRHRFALALALLVGAPAALAAPPLAKATLAGGDHRFIEAPAGSGVQFFVNGGTQSIGFGPAGAEMRLPERSAKSTAAARPLRFEFDDARPVAPEGVDAASLRYHWLVGPRESWATDLRSFRAIVYRGLWPGIDATWHGDKAGLKYEFAVQPGVDPARIAMNVRNAEDARLTPDGAIEWLRAGQWQRDEAPLAWQETNSRTVPVRATYLLEKAAAGTWRVSFKLGPYDPERTLIVDPAWSAFSGLVGGNASDQVHSVARDSSGNTFACGITSSSDLPLVSPLSSYPGAGENAFIVKFNAAGQPQFVTYLGGSGFDTCNGVAVDSLGAVYAAGGTTSTNFPFAGTGDGNFLRSKSTGDRDAFVVKLHSSGSSLTYAGVLGGAGEDQAQAIALDTFGRAYIAGYAAPGFPAINGPRLTHGGDASGTFFQDPFVARVNSSGTALEYSGFLGGDGGIESGRGIAVNGSDEAVVVGETNSTSGLPSMSGTFRTLHGIGDGDGFVARLTSSGAFQWFSVLAGVAGAHSGTDRALAVAFTSSGSITVAGETDSEQFPANNAGIRLGTGQQNALAGNMDGFVVRINSTGSVVEGATYLGGDRFDAAEAVAVDGLGNVHVAGTTSPSVTTHFPVVATAGLSTTRFGAQDGFLARIASSSSATATFSGFVGANAGAGPASTHDALHAIAGSSGSSGILSLGGATGAPGLAQYTGTTTGGIAANGLSPNGIVIRVNPNPNVLVALSGTPQGTLDGTAFAAPLVVRVQDQDGNPLSNFQVTFTAPLSGPRASLSPATPTLTSSVGTAQVGATATGGPGTYNVQASVPGLGSVTFALANQVQSSVAIAASAATIAQGGSVTFTATVTGSSPTGTVTFNEGATVLCNAVALAGTSAQCQTATLAPGAHAITAAYSGDTINIGATSPSTTVTVTAAAPRTTDFNGDGKPDLLWRNAASGATYVWFMNGLVLQSDQHLATVDPSWKVEGTGDFNGDGHVDVIWRNTVSGAAYVWYLNNGALVSDVLLFTIDPVWRVAGVADFNLDGKPDLLMRNASSGLAFVWYFNGATPIGDQFLFSIDTSWKVEGIGDFNSDGKPDLLFRNSGSGLAFAWFTEHSGGTTTLAGSSPSMFTIDPAWEVVQVADWNADGKVDLVFRNTGSGVVFVWYVNGTTLAASDFIIQIDPSWEIVPRR